MVLRQICHLGKQAGGQNSSGDWRKCGHREGRTKLIILSQVELLLIILDRRQSLSLPGGELEKSSLAVGNIYL